MEATQRQTDEYDARRWASEVETVLATVANPAAPFARLPLPPEPGNPSLELARELVDMSRVWTDRVPGIAALDEAAERILEAGGGQNFPGLRAAVTQTLQRLAVAIDQRLQRLGWETPREAGLISPNWFPGEVVNYLGHPLTNPVLPLLALRWDTFDRLPPGHWLRDAVADLRDHTGGLILGPGGRDLVGATIPRRFYPLDMALRLTGEALNRQRIRAERDRLELERQIPSNRAPDPFASVPRHELENRLRALEARLAQLPPTEGN